MYIDAFRALDAKTIIVYFTAHEYFCVHIHPCMYALCGPVPSQVLLPL